MDEAKNPRLVGEHAHEVLVTAVGGEDPLHDDVTLETGRADGAGLEYLGHAAHPEWMQKLVVAEPLRAIDAPACSSQPRCLPQKSFQQHCRASDQLRTRFPESPIRLKNDSPGDTSPGEHLKSRANGAPDGDGAFLPLPARQQPGP